MGDKVYAVGAPPFPLGTIDWPVPFSYLLYSGVDPANLGSYEGLAYLLSGTPFDDSLTTIYGGPPFPFGEIDYPVPLQYATRGKLRQVYMAATIGRSSAPADVPANTYVPGKLEGNLNYGVELFDGADPTSTGSSTTGVMQIDDPDGELDGFKSLGWDGAALQLTRGDPTTLFSTWSVIANVTAAGILYDQRKKEIQFRDLSWLLSAAPLHGQIYGGTGGVDGDAGLVGVYKPYAIGHYFNVTPTQIGAALLCYQVSCSSVVSITVSDGGLALIDDGDVADYATLAAATIGIGHYLTCLALGLFRLGGAPALIVTASGIGDADTINGHTTPSTRAQIARRIATGRGAVVLDDATQIDAAAYTYLETQQVAPCGYFWNAAITKADALTEVMAGCLGWWFMRLNGQLAIGQVEDPALATAYLSLSFPAVDAGEVRVGEPTMIDYKPPRQATYIGYSKNYTPLQTNQIAGAVDATTNAILVADTRYAASIDGWVATSYPTAPVVQVEGGFAFAADALVEANRQQALLRTRRERWQIVIAMDQAADVVGRILNLANFNRFGFGASRNLLCVGIDAANGTVTLDFWG